MFVIGVGIIFAVLAYIDGYISDDPYPGYGDVYRAALTEKRTIENRIHHIHDRWHSNKKSVLSMFLCHAGMIGASIAATTRKSE